MKVFFAGSIRGGRQLISTYRHIMDLVKSCDHTIMSEHVVSRDLERKEAAMSEQEIFEKDIDWIREADCVIAEVTVPSTGTGYEICHAITLRKPVLCLYAEGSNASAMVLGNTSRYLTVRSYSDPSQIEEMLLDFLKQPK